MKRFTFGLGALAVATLLSACGGGGGGGSTSGMNDPIVLNVAGLWTGSTAANQKITAVTYLDGTGWALLQDPSANGYVQYMNFEGQVSRGSLTTMMSTHYVNTSAANADTPMAALVVPKTAITMTTLSGGFGVFAGSYDRAFELVPDKSALPGVYAATVNYKNGATISATPLLLDLTVDGNGALTGGNADCVVTGNLEPRVGKRDYSASVDIANGANPCPVQASNLSGLAFHHQQDLKLFGYLANSSGDLMLTLAAVKN